MSVDQFPTDLFECLLTFGSNRPIAALRTVLLAVNDLVIGRADAERITFVAFRDKPSRDVEDTNYSLSVSLA